MRIFAKLLLLFTTVTLLELAILIEIGKRLDVPATLGIVVLTGVVGSMLAASQGLRVVGEMKEQVMMGRMPTDSIVDGLLVLSAGIMLLTPGLLTDSAGLLLLVPRGRRFVRERLKRYLGGKVQHYMYREERRWE